MLNKLFFLILLSLFSQMTILSMANAGQVTMASYDFDSDGYDEIIKTDEADGKTFIRFYKKIENSFFYKPIQIFEVPGRLVQVPEIEDINEDGVNDYYFATGADIGIIYYSRVKDSFIKTNNFEFNAYSNQTKDNTRILKKKIANDALIQLSAMKENDETNNELNNFKEKSNNQVKPFKIDKPIVKANDSSSDDPLINIDNINVI